MSHNKKLTSELAQALIKETLVKELAEAIVNEDFKGLQERFNVQPIVVRQHFQHPKTPVCQGCPHPDGRYFHPAKPICTLPAFASPIHDHAKQTLRPQQLFPTYCALRTARIQESQITDLVHDATKIQGVTVDDAAIGDQKVLAYDLASGTIIYITGGSHRKWSWSDEQGWIKHYRIPLGSPRRYAVNPVMSYPAGETQVNSPNIMRRAFTADDAVEYTYWMWFSVVWTIGKFYVAYSNDGISWTLGNSGNPIITKGAGWDSAGINSLSVIYDEYDNIYKMWYTGRSGGGVNAIGHATASDPEGPWTVFAGNPVYTPANLTNEGIAVFRFGNFRYMGYGRLIAGVKELYAAYSSTNSDTANWVEWGKILAVGAAGTWDDTQAKQFSMFWNQGVWYIFYTGWDGVAPVKLRIGAAMSYNGFRLFDKVKNTESGSGLTGDGLIMVEQGAGFEGTRVMYPYLIQVDDTFWMYYIGENATARRELGLSYMP